LIEVVAAIHDARVNDRGRLEWEGRDATLRYQRRAGCSQS